MTLLHKLKTLLIYFQFYKNIKNAADLLSILYCSKKDSADPFSALCCQYKTLLTYFWHYIAKQMLCILTLYCNIQILLIYFNHYIATKMILLVDSPNYFLIVVIVIDIAVCVCVCVWTHPYSLTHIFTWLWWYVPYKENTNTYCDRRVTPVNALSLYVLMQVSIMTDVNFGRTYCICHAVCLLLRQVTLSRCGTRYVNIYQFLLNSSKAQIFVTLQF